jgi:hypothetical protein
MHFSCGKFLILCIVKWKTFLSFEITDMVFTDLNICACVCYDVLYLRKSGKPDFGVGGRH